MEEIKEQEQLHHAVTVENLEGLKRKVNITIDIEVEVGDKAVTGIQ